VRYQNIGNFFSISDIFHANLLPTGINTTW